MLFQIYGIVKDREVFNIYTTILEILSHFVDSLAQKGAYLYSASTSVM